MAEFWRVTWLYTILIVFFVIFVYTQYKDDLDQWLQSVGRHMESFQDGTATKESDFGQDIAKGTTKGTSQDIADELAKENTYKGVGYANESDEYDAPIVHPNFISEAEARHILTEAKSRFETSVIFGGLDTNIRKSETAWLPKTDPMVRQIIQRACNMAHYSINNAEELQVVRYQPNGFYNEHHDAACNDNEQCQEFVKNGGNRVLTVLIYLTDDFEGGATRFPNLDKEFKPSKYSAVVFHPLEKWGNRCHPHALHAGMPVLSGEKYICNIWIHEGNFSSSH
jgi:prolyl 4-hydroxylase